MPSQISGPFSLGGIYKPDAFDEGDRFSANLEENRRQALQARIDQLGMLNYNGGIAGQQLAEQRHEFDVGHGDSLALQRAMLQSMAGERAERGRQFDVTTGLEKERQGFEFDPARNPTLSAQLASAKALTSQADTAAEQLRMRKDFNEKIARGADVPGLGSIDPQGRAMATLVAGAGGDVGQALGGIIQQSRATAAAKLAQAREDLGQGTAEGQQIGKQEYNEAIAAGAQPVGKTLHVAPEKVLMTGQAGRLFSQFKSELERYKEASGNMPYRKHPELIQERMASIHDAARAQGADDNEVQNYLLSYVNEHVPQHTGAISESLNKGLGWVPFLGKGTNSEARVNSLRDVLGL